MSPSPRSSVSKRRPSAEAPPKHVDVVGSVESLSVGRVGVVTGIDQRVDCRFGIASRGCGPPDPTGRPVLGGVGWRVVDGDCLAGGDIGLLE